MRPARIFSRVDLPHPDFPNITIKSFSAIERLIFSKTINIFLLGG